MRILIDMDGVTVALLEEWIRRYNVLWDDNLPISAIKSWSVHEWVKPECGKRVYEILYHRGLFDNLRPHDGAIEAITQLHEDGHDIRFATATPTADAAKGKMNWIAREFKHLGFGTSHVMQLHDKTWINADILIDDKAETIKKWKAWSETPHPKFTTPVIMAVAHPYNRDCEDVADVYAESSTDMQAAWSTILSAVRKLESER